MNDTNRIILQNKPKPFWKIIAAAFLYTVSVLCIWVGYFRMTHPDLYTVYEYRNSVILMEMALFPFLLAVHFSISQKKEINIKSKKIITQFSIGGSLKIYENSKLENFEYVSVFFDSKQVNYMINLWYKRNKFYSLCSFEDFDSAMDFGKMLSNKFQINLLDATVKGNFKWIENKNE